MKESLWFLCERRKAAESHIGNRGKTDCRQGTQRIVGAE